MKYRIYSLAVEQDVYYSTISMRGPSTISVSGSVVSTVATSISPTSASSSSSSTAISIHLQPLLLLIQHSIPRGGEISIVMMSTGRRETTASSEPHEVSHGRSGHRRHTVTPSSSVSSSSSSSAGAVGTRIVAVVAVGTISTWVTALRRPGTTSVARRVVPTVVSSSSTIPTIVSSSPPIFSPTVIVSIPGAVVVSVSTPIPAGRSFFLSFASSISFRLLLLLDVRRSWWEQRLNTRRRHEPVAIAVTSLIFWGGGILHLLLMMRWHIWALSVKVERLSLMLVHLGRGHEPAVMLLLHGALLLLLLHVLGLTVLIVTAVSVAASITHLDIPTEQGDSLHGLEGVGDADRVFKIDESKVLIGGLFYGRQRTDLQEKFEQYRFGHAVIQTAHPKGRIIFVTHDSSSIWLWEAGAYWVKGIIAIGRVVISLALTNFNLSK